MDKSPCSSHSGPLGAAKNAQISPTGPNGSGGPNAIETIVGPLGLYGQIALWLSLCDPWGCKKMKKSRPLGRHSDHWAHLGLRGLYKK